MARLAVVLPDGGGRLHFAEGLALGDVAGGGTVIEVVGGGADVVAVGELLDVVAVAQVAELARDLLERGAPFLRGRGVVRGR